MNAVFLSFSGLTASVGLPPELECDGVDLRQLDAIVVRPIGRGSLEQTLFRVDALHKLSRMGLIVINHPSSIEKAVDKYYAITLLHEKGVPVPRTVITESVPKALAAFKEFDGEVVVKPIFGSRGIGSARVSNPDVAERVFRTLRFHRELMYVQEFISHGSRDIRVFVVGDRVVACMARCSESWKTNVSLGATPTQLELSSEIEELSLTAAKIIGCEVAGVDLMESERGLLVTEINSQPGWKGLQSVATLDIAAEIADYIIKRDRQ